MKHLCKTAAAFLVLFPLAFPSHAALKAGDVDLNFATTASVNGPIYTVAAQPDGRVLIGGNFSSVGGTNRYGIARLNVDGSLDHSFQDGMYDGVVGSVYSIALQANGKVLIGGYFIGVNGVTRRGIARLNADGSLDAGFQNGMYGADIYLCGSIFDPCQSYVATVRSVAVQSAGKVFIGGAYNRVNQTTHNGITMLGTNGSVDPGFLDHWAGASYPTDFAVAAQLDGKVIVGGDFGIVRLNADGHRDTNYQSVVFGGSSYVYSLALQSDGKMLIGGAFTSVSGTNRNHLARLNANGSLDTSFQNGMAGTDGSVFSVAVQSDGRVLVGGAFYSVNGIARNCIARLNADGSLDQSCLNGMAGTDDSVASIALQSDGNILIGGLFANVNGLACAFVARLYGTAPLYLGDFGIVSNKFGFNVSGESNQVVIVEGSTNLVNWTPLKTNTLGAGLIPFSDPIPHNLTQRFYRARSQ